MTSFFEIAGWTLIHFVWQGAAIGLVTAALLRATVRRSPNVRYVIACAGLALLIAAPAATASLLSNDGAVRFTPAAFDGQPGASIPTDAREGFGSNSGAPLGTSERAGVLDSWSRRNPS